MIKYFELLLDLLNIEDNWSYVEIAKLIEKNKDKDLKVYHQYFFIFEWYRDLLDWKIDTEEFLKIWDIWSRVRFPDDKPDSISLLSSDFTPDKNTMYIFDSLAEWIIPEQDNVFYC